MVLSFPENEKDGGPLLNSLVVSRMGAGMAAPRSVSVRVNRRGSPTETSFASISVLASKDPIAPWKSFGLPFIGRGFTWIRYSGERTFRDSSFAEAKKRIVEEWIAKRSSAIACTNSNTGIETQWVIVTWRQ